MQLAQRLYESGQITYMRTDSVNLSQTAQDDIKGAITKSYGEKFSKPRQYKTKSSFGARGARSHQADIYVEHDC